MYRSVSILVIVCSGFAGGFLARAERAGVLEPPAPASTVALERAPEPEDAPKLAPGNALGTPLKTAPDGAAVPAEGDKITALDARDPSSMVMGPALDGSPCPPDPPCDCSKDSLHRYQRPAPKRESLESLPPAGEPPAAK